MSHHRLLASLSNTRQQETNARIGLPPVRPRYFRRTAADVQRSDAGDFRLAQITMRGAAGVDSTALPTTSSGEAARMATTADRSRSAEEKEQTQLVMKPPAVHFVEVEAKLVATQPVSRARRLQSVPLATPSTTVVLPRLRDAVVAGDTHSRVAASLQSHDPALDSYTTAHRRLSTAERGFLELQAGAHEYLLATATAPADAEHEEAVPRRLQAVNGSHTTLFSVSPTAHASASGFHDVPPALDVDDVGSESSGRDHSACSTVGDLLDQSDLIDSAHGSRSDMARCLGDFVSAVGSIAEVRDDLLAALHVESLYEIDAEHPHGAQALFAAASSRGDAMMQRALCDILLDMDHETPEMLHVEDAHLFFHIVSAISELTAPTHDTFDALFESLRQHESHYDQWHQVLLAAAALGKTLPRDHPDQRRVLQLLLSNYDAALERNQATEQRFAEHVASARDVMALMPPEEQHMWMAHVQHLDRRTWQEVWDVSSAGQRQRYLEETVEVIARIMAHDIHDEDDGYGLKAQYARPARRLRPNPPRYDASVQFGFNETGHSDYSQHGLVMGEDGDAALLLDNGDTFDLTGVPRMTRSSEGHERAFAAALKLQATDLRFAVQALANLAHPESYDRIVGLARHRRLAVRGFAVHALRVAPCHAARRVLIDVFSDNEEDSALRRAAVDALGSWPTEHLEGGDGEVLEAALRHLGENHGVDWDVCEITCADSCFHRSILHCRSMCKDQCGGRSSVEQAVVSLLHMRWGHAVGEDDTETDIDARVRRLAGVDENTEVDMSLYDDDDDDVPDHVVRHRGARRLFNLLSVLEDIFSYTKFQFQVCGSLLS